MEKYIYLITSPSSKVYVGQSMILIEQKINSYRRLEKYDKTDRKIANAIRKYSWKEMKFEVIESSDSWTKEQLNEREIYWISYYNSVDNGYNMTIGGDGVDSELARQLALRHHTTMSIEKKQQRSANCSAGQRNRYKNDPDSNVTKQRKSDSHKGKYLIESPDGRVWETDIGLKDFAEKYSNELGINYWKLFNAYRKCYNNIQVTKIRKDHNNWKVTRID